MFIFMLTAVPVISRPSLANAPQILAPQTIATVAPMIPPPGIAIPQTVNRPSAMIAPMPVVIPPPTVVTPTAVGTAIVSIS